MDDVIGFFKSADGRYAVLADPGGVSWQDAAAAAEAMGGHLAIVQSAAESEFLAATVGGLDAAWVPVADEREAGPWIGARLGEDGVFRWVNGEPLDYANWAEREPNDYLGDETAVHLETRTAPGEPREPGWNDLPDSGAWPLGTRRVTSFVVEKAGAVPDAEGRAIAYLYEAALDRDGAIDIEGLTFWIGVRGGGMSLERISAHFLESEEFAAAFGDPDALGDRALVERLYLNVLDREGDSAGIDFWTEAVGRPEYGRDRLLLDFALSPENAASSGYIETLAEQPFDDWQFG